MKPLHYAKQIAYSSWDVLLFTYEMAVKFKDSPGVYVECGVAAGAQIIAMAYGAPNKTIYAFDSFEGIPLPSNRDDQMPGIANLSQWEIDLLPPPGKQALKTTGATAVSLESFWKNMFAAFGKEYGPLDINGIPPIDETFPNIETRIGWFENTVKQFDWLNPNAISILRLDGDLYNSTWVCLQHLFPKVIQGGCVIIDDWTLQGCQAACKEYFELIGYEPDYKFLDGTAYFYK